MSKWLSKKLIFRIMILARSLSLNSSHHILENLRTSKYFVFSRSSPINAAPTLIKQCKLNQYNDAGPWPYSVFWQYEANSSPNSSADWLSNTIKMKAFGLHCNNQGDYYTAGLAPPVGLTFLQHSLTPRPIWVPACHEKVKLTRWTLRRLVALSKDHAGNALLSAVCLA